MQKAGMGDAQVAGVDAVRERTGFVQQAMDWAKAQELDVPVAIHPMAKEKMTIDNVPARTIDRRLREDSELGPKWTKTLHEDGAIIFLRAHGCCPPNGGTER